MDAWNVGSKGCSAPLAAPTLLVVEDSIPENGTAHLRMGLPTTVSLSGVILTGSPEAGLLGNS